MTSVRTASRIGCGVVLLAGLMSFGGCGGGDGGPPRFQVSGNVTYGGQPVPAGSIMFEPDATKGNRGPAGFAKINNGKYDTKLDGEGAIGGPHLIRITALDGVAKPDSPEGVPLCPDYSTTADLPKEKTTKDFDIPKGGGGGKAQPKKNIYEGV